MEKTGRRLIAAAVLALLTCAGTWLDRDMQRMIGVLAGIASLALLVVSRVHLGASFSVKPVARSLVTSGLYSKIEHPLYCFLDLLLVALILFLGMPILLSAWGLLVVIHLIECRREERILAAAFGQEYVAYRKQTWL